MIRHTGNHWGHGNCNWRSKKNLETAAGKLPGDSLSLSLS